MTWLNYHHLLYFWVVAREGGLAPAGRVLHLSHPTLSAQIRALEASLGASLFSRAGRRLTLTDTGHTVFRYADEIFALGRELVDTVQGRTAGLAARLHVGVADSVPKLVARRLLEPALALDPPTRLVVHEDTHDRLLAELALHTIQLVLSDAPVAPGGPVRAFAHTLGESGVSLFAAPAVAGRLRRRFPRSLHGAPMLLPLDTLPLRRALNHWFDRVSVRPHVVAEFADSALFKVFGADGGGVFPAPTVVEDEVRRQYGVRLVGRVDEVVERFYAITAERRLTHPAVLAISRTARTELFGRR